MLDHVAVGAFLEQPARKDAIPFIVALILHRQLDEGAGFRRVFPWRGRLARAQAHDSAANARRIAGLHLEIANQAVALVEQAEHRDAVGHRGRALDSADFLRHAFGFGDLRRLLAAARLGRRRPVAGRESQCRQGGEAHGRGQARHENAHSAPGRQAS
ncbi:hypothetical protein FHR22_003888 [Sphingopyxis panaciterrae]|nr:hypothetical protein [Sphingopyxis panaciterrae]